MSYAQKIVQSCHAIYDCGQSSKTSEIPFIILFGVRNQKKLKKILTEVQNLDIKCYCFNEPDIGNEMTAFVTEPLDSRPEYFSKFTLLK